MASLSQGRTAAAQCGLFIHKSVPVIFEPPFIYIYVKFLLTKIYRLIIIYAGTHAPRNAKDKFKKAVSQRIKSKHCEI